MKLSEKIIKGFISLLTDEKGSISSKRFVGLLTSIVLCFALIYNVFINNSTGLSDSLINAVALLAFGSLGLSSVDKFAGIKNKISNFIKLPEDK